MITKIKSSTVHGMIIGDMGQKWIPVVDHPKPGLPLLGGLVNVPYGGSLGSNQDDVHNTETIVYDQQGRNVPNYCHHTCPRKAKFSSLDDCCSGGKGQIPLWEYSIEPKPDGWAYSDRSVYTMRWLPNLPGGVSNGWIKTIGSEPDDTANLTRAIADLRAGLLAPVFNIPRAVIELKDLNQTLKGVMEVMKALQGIGRLGGSLALSGVPSGIDGRRPAFNPNLRLHGRQITSDRWSAMQNLVSATKGSLYDVAAAYLTYQFGIRPTASDIRSFIGLAKPISKDGRWTGLLFEARRVEYKRGQKLRIPYTLGCASELPSLESYREVKRVALLRDWHTEIWPNAAIGDFLSRKALCHRGRSIRGLVFGEVEADKTVHIPYSELMAYSGGFFSTIYEVTPWTWVVDSVVDVGKYLQTLERMSLPAEYRPVLKYGTWLAKASSLDYYIPMYRNIGWISEIITHPDPSSGYGGEIEFTANVNGPSWKLVYQDDHIFHREPVLALDAFTDVPKARIPGRYTLGPMAALITQLAIGGKGSYVRSSSITGG